MSRFGRQKFNRFFEHFYKYMAIKTYTLTILQIPITFSGDFVLKIFEVNFYLVGDF